MKKIVFGLVSLVLITGCGSESLEKQFEAYVVDYYENTIKDTSQSDFYTFSLIDIANAGFDVENFEKKKCIEKSVAILTKDREKKYTISVNLICEDK